MPAWLSLIATGLAWLARTFLNRAPAAVAVSIAEAEKAGAAAQAAADAQAQVRSEAAVAQAAVRAVVEAPDTADEVAGRMEQGTF
jgi:hypothetical protein